MRHGIPCTLTYTCGNECGATYEESSDAMGLGPGAGGHAGGLEGWTQFGIERDAAESMQNAPVDVMGEFCDDLAEIDDPNTPEAARVALRKAAMGFRESAFPSRMPPFATRASASLLICPDCFPTADVRGLLMNALERAVR